ncbi:MAG: trypsin-like peptidase domain-containing protein [Bacteroidota bacterium]|jgi:S1-C subfamily serine protease|nr:trypsin-like peptidase domain-containing protein [Bacteroidota bacterium]
MRAAILSTVFFLMLPLAGHLDASIDNRSIVKIFVTSIEPNSSRPWAPEAPMQSSGTGFVIEGNRILTNAHVISHSTFIMVRKGGDSKRHEAEAEFVSHQADLAILRIKDASFFDGLTPLRIGENPAVQDALIVVGYPSGGDELSITSGIVSRIEVNAYSWSFDFLLTVQVDAAINPGNSGGPAIKDDRVAGIAMMGRRNADGVGYLIPPVIIQHFLEDIEDGRVDGFPNLGVQTMTLENPALRAGYGLDPTEDHGILVTRVTEIPGRSSSLRGGDIILAVDDHPVRANGKVLIGERLLDLSFVVTGRQVGDALPMRIRRNGLDTVLTLVSEFHPDLVEYRYFERGFPYYLFGGLLFCPLYGDVLFASDWPDPEMYYHTTLPRSPRRRQVLYLHTIFQHELTRGMPGLEHIVRTINDAPVRDFDELVRLLDAAAGLVDIEFDSGIRLRLDADAMRSIEADVMETYSIQRPLGPATVAR